MIKMCGNCGEGHKYVDCPYTEDRIKKEEYEKLRETEEKLKEIDFVVLMAAMYTYEREKLEWGLVTETKEKIMELGKLLGKIA